MQYSLPENILILLSEFIALNLALNFSKDKWCDLERNIATAAKESGYNDVEEYITYFTSLPTTPEKIELLAANLTINESYFWREPQTFDALEQIIIPELIRRSENGVKSIRIWSAGCSTGEEPYSIVIALHRTIPQIKDWKTSILATDINRRVLQKATIGEYRPWSFRGAPDWLKEKYFTQTAGNRFEIIPEIKRMVKFDYLNMADESYPSVNNNTHEMDLIYCRNVLMYFTPDRFRQVTHAIFKSLVPGGYLVVSASELSFQNFTGFIPVYVPGMVLYQKSTSKIKNQFNFTFDISRAETESVQNPQEPDYPAKCPKIDSLDISGSMVSNDKESLQLYSKGNYTDVIDKPQNESQTFEKQLLIIKALANQGNYIGAIKVCENAIAANKSEPRLHYLYATILLENQLTDQALASLKRAIYLDADFVLAYYSMRNIYQKQGNAKVAQKHHEIILSILNKLKNEDILFESEGLTNGSFREMIDA